VAEERVPSGAIPPGFRLPLKVKLSLLITALLTLTVLLVSAFLLRQSQRDLTDQMTKRGLTIAENLAASAKSPLLTEDELTLNVLVKDAMKDRDVAYVVIADHHGKAIAHSDVSLVGKPVERPRGLKPLADARLVQTYRSEDQGDLIDVAVPLLFRNVPVGSLYLGFSQKSIVEALARARRNAVIISAAMVLVGIAGAVVLASLLSRPILRLMEGTRAIASGDFLVALPIPSRDEIGALTQAFNTMAKSLREKEMIKRAFTRYVAREVVDEVLKDPEKLVLTGERRDVTVLFSDLRGFSEMSEHLGAEAVIQLVNRYLGAVTPVILRHGGTIVDFIGDGIFVLFGAPFAREDAAAQALRCAWSMQQAMDEVNMDSRKLGLPEIGMGIAVHAGRAVVGNIGSVDRVKYGAVGPPVNTAAHLQAHARAGEVLVSAPALARGGAIARVDTARTIELKGRAAPLTAYPLVGVAPE